MTDIEYTRYRPSVIAAAAICLASYAQYPKRRRDLFECIMSCKRLDKKELHPCVKMIRDMRKSQAGEASTPPTPVVETLFTGLLEEAKNELRRQPLQDRLEMIEESKSEDENMVKNDRGSLATASSLNQPDDVQEPGRTQPTDDAQDRGRDQSSDVQEPGRNQSLNVNDPGRNQSSDVHDPGKNQLSDDVANPRRNPEETDKHSSDSDDADKKCSVCNCCAGARKKSR